VQVFLPTVRTPARAAVLAERRIAIHSSISTSDGHKGELRLPEPSAGPLIDREGAASSTLDCACR